MGAWHGLGFHLGNPGTSQTPDCAWPPRSYQDLASSVSYNYAYSQLQQPSPKWRAALQSKRAWRAGAQLLLRWMLSGHTKLARVPGSFNSFLYLVSGLSKHVPARHKSHLGFLLLLYQSHWFSNQLRRFDFLVLDHKAGVPHLWFKLLTPLWNLWTWVFLLLSVTSLGHRSWPDFFFSFPTQLCVCGCFLQSWL